MWAGCHARAAALVQGYARFDPDVRVAGVVLNRVGGPRHYQLVKTAIEEQAGVAVWGYLPWDDGLVLPERHLGLVPVGEDAAFQRVCAELGAAADRTIDISAIIARLTRSRPSMYRLLRLHRPQPSGREIGVRQGCGLQFLL